MMRLLQYGMDYNGIRLFLLGAFLVAVFTARWPEAFVSLSTLALSYLPSFLSQRFGVLLPRRFLALITGFLFATLFLGEVFDFYERYWWWDVVLHGGSAMGFGLMGVILVLLLFEGDRYAAPPLAMAMISFCVAISIGGLWEIFEFAMDEIFGLNMQKSGLPDTMWDLIVNAIGAFVGATIGWFYLKGRELGGSGGLIGEFVRLNRKLFRRFR